MAIVAEKQSKLELLSKSNALKRAVPKKQVKLDACLQEKRDLFKDKRNYDLLSDFI